MRQYNKTKDIWNAYLVLVVMFLGFFLFVWVFANYQQKEIKNMIASEADDAFLFLF